MKKAALITAMLMTLSFSAAAFNSEEGGYSVNDSKALATVTSQKTFAMFEEVKEQSSIKVINYFKADEVKTATEQDFNAETFNKLYDQLALLDRSKLKLDRLPLEFLDLEKYAKANLPGSLVIFRTPKDSDEKDINPELRIDTLGKYKTMSSSYYYKEEDQYVGMTNTFLVNNNQLYLLTTINKLSEPVKEAKEEEKTEPGTKLRKLNEEPKEKDKLAIIDPKEVSNTIKDNQWQKQLNFIKTVKLSTPVPSSKPFGFQDSFYGKQVNLPDEWAFSQIKMNDNGNKGLVTIAAPLNSLRYVTGEALDESLGIYQKEKPKADDLMDKLSEEEFAKDSEDYKNAHNYLEKLDQVLITGSFTVEDKDLVAQLKNPQVLKTEADLFLKAGLDRLKRMPTPEFKLNDYDYKFEAKDNKALVDVSADMTLLENINLDAQFKGAAKNNAIMLLIYAKKKDQLLEEVLDKALKEWKF